MSLMPTPAHALPKADVCGVNTISRQRSREDGKIHCYCRVGGSTTEVECPDSGGTDAGTKGSKKGTAEPVKPRVTNPEDMKSK
jgi:hypothetical protein